MDPHRQFHHNHHYHHHQPRQHHPQFIDSSSSSRYLPLRPPPPPFPDDFPPPQRHLPPPLPPPQHHTLSPHPPPCLIHNPPPPPPPPRHPPPAPRHHPPPPHSFDDHNFVNSPPHHHYHQHQLQHQHQHQHHHHHHQLQHRRIIEDEHRDVFRSPTRVIPPNRVLGFENHNQIHIHNHNHNLDDDIDRRPRFRLNELPPPPHLPPPSRVAPLSPIAHRSPPQCVQFERFRREIRSPPRFREDLSLESRPRLHADEIEFHQLHHQLHRDQIDDRRILGVVDRLEGDFDRDCDRDHHERYLPEMVRRKEFELNSGNNDLRGSLNDEVFIRGGRDDDVVLEDNVNMRRGGGGSREVSRSPIKFRTGGMEVDDGLSDRGRKEEIQEFSNHGTPKKNLQKKSAFLRIQPAKQQQHNRSSFRNRFDNTSSSPNKGKESNSEFLDHRTSEERVGSPVELNVSFKSNALVAKAIMAAPSCSGVDFNANDTLSDSGARLEGECPSKVVSFKINSPVFKREGKCPSKVVSFKINSPASKREGKDYKNRVRVSPILKRLGDPDNVQVHSNHLESSRGGSSSLSGGITQKTSPKDEVLGKDDRNTGFEKVSFSAVRRKRKAISPLSRLSSPVPTKAGSELVNEDSSANHTSDDSMPSDVSLNQSEMELSCVGNVTESTKNVHESSTVVDQEEVFRSSVSEESPPKRMRESEIMEPFPDSPGSLGLRVSEGHGNTKEYLQGEQIISNSDGDVTKVVENYSSDIHTEKNSEKLPDLAHVLGENGSAVGTPEAAVVCMGDNVHNNDICCENVDTSNSVDVISSIPIPLDISNKREKVDSMCPVVDADKPCETQAFSSPENATSELSLGGLHSDRNYKPELKHSEDSEKVESFSIDVSSDKNRTSLIYDDDVTFGSKNINNVSDVRVTNDIQDQQCRVLDTTSPNDEPTLEREGSLVMNMECDDNIAQNFILSSVSGSPQSCAEPTYGGVTTNSGLLDTPVNVGIPETQSVFSPTVSTSNASLEIQVSSGENPSMNDKKTNQPLAKDSSFTSQANALFGSQKTNCKPGVSASVDVQPCTQKSVSLLKHVKATTSSSNSTSGLRRNVITRSEASPSTNRRSSVFNPSNKAQTFPAIPRTWHRTNNLAAPNIPAKKPSVVTPSPQRPLYGKALKVQDSSYIRKGNSLVRNFAAGPSTKGFRAFGSSIDQSKPNDMIRTRKMVGSVMIEPTELPDGLVTGGRSAPIEMPKTPPLPCSGKTSDNDIAYSGECTSFLPSEGTDNQEALKSSDARLNSFKDPELVVSKNLEDPGMFSDGDVLTSNSKRMIYIKRKSNQLIAASKTSQSSVCSMDNKVASSSDNYYKRRKHQLIRASSEGNLQQLVAVIEGSSKSLSQRILHGNSGKSSTKKLSNKVKSSNHSLVWKLGDSRSCGKGIDALRSGSLLSHLLPWKRATYWGRKLLSSRKRGVVYVRSGRGFSLRRSKVVSLPGTSLKWSKSMEKRSKKVEKEAARAVAVVDSVQKSGSSDVSLKSESSLHPLQKPGHGLKLHSGESTGERIFRVGVFRYRMDPSRRTLQRIPDEEADFTASRTGKDARKTYVPKRLLIGSNEYVRIGNGNQLVRDPKRRTRILASEKVRWSLHTARMRLAKKRKFCQFFTRFGKCNKSEGKCPFIHDPSKIAVCTKFLKGLCSDPNCKLTHKVIPERMPDCSFFLQGSCSNEKCPYRHVNVNPKASICESFLRGYCAEGNECRKKHSYICPAFEASGSCPQGSKCKLYHPKKGKAKKRKVSRDQKNAEGRYFCSGLSVVDPETRPIFEKHVVPNKSSLVLQGELGDFIGLDVSDDEAREDELPSDRTLSEDDPLNSELDDLDELIKPLRILGRL